MTKSTTSIERFKFIAHALNGDGPFRPQPRGESVGETALVRYPRESDAKFARRNDVAWYDAPLYEVVSRFVGFLSSRPPIRYVQSDLYDRIIDDADGQGNALDVLWSEFAVQAAARGSMLLLVDMPAVATSNRAEQIAARVVPSLSPIEPERLTAFQVGADGKFDFVEFVDDYTTPDGALIEGATWRFDRAGWLIRDEGDEIIDGGDHPLGECPVLIFTESGGFPCFGRFAPIADLAKRLFNLNSELDEILRSQTFSLLTMQVPDDSTDEAKIGAARLIGETIGTSNLMVHSGSTPAFIAPPDGPARVYLERIAKLEERIEEIGLKVSGSRSAEAGVALQMRFHALNTALATYSGRLEDFERRVWEIARRWLGLTAAPEIMWPRDFSIADVEMQMLILQQMRTNAMPIEVIVEQERKLVGIQFPGLEAERADAINAAIDQRTQEVQ